VTRRRALRATAFGSAVLTAGALIVVVILAITFIRKPLPERGGTVSLVGLKGKVTVLRDDRAVPQIYADNPEDLFRVQGYVNAQDRFFQMDLDRHVTAGRLSELVGKDVDALRADTLVRTLGWRMVAEQEFKQVSASTRKYLEAYADGVNDYIRVSQPLSCRSATPCWAGPIRYSRSSPGPQWTRSPGSRRWRGTFAATTTRNWSGPER
jgi:penicillin amidase